MLLSNNNNQCHVLSQDDAALGLDEAWIWLCEFRKNTPANAEIWQLRKQVRALNGFFNDVGFCQHSDKTFISRTERGFDWMGAQMSDVGVEGIAHRARANHLERLRRLYEQVRRWARMSQYRAKWKIWAQSIVWGEGAKNSANWINRVPVIYATMCEKVPGILTRVCRTIYHCPYVPLVLVGLAPTALANNYTVKIPDESGYTLRGVTGSMVPTTGDSYLLGSNLIVGIQSGAAQMVQSDITCPPGTTEVGGGSCGSLTPRPNDGDSQVFVDYHGNVHCSLESHGNGGLVSWETLIGSVAYEQKKGPPYLRTDSGYWTKSGPGSDAFTGDLIRPGITMYPWYFVQGYYPYAGTIGDSSIIAAFGQSSSSVPSSLDIVGDIYVGNLAVPGVYTFSPRFQCQGINPPYPATWATLTWVVTVEKPDNACSVTLDGSHSLSMTWSGISYNSPTQSPLLPFSGTINVSCKPYAYANAAKVSVGLGTTGPVGDQQGGTDDYRLYTGVPGWSITGRVSDATTTPYCTGMGNVSRWNRSATLGAASYMTPVTIGSNNTGTGYYWFALCRSNGTTKPGTIGATGYVGVYVQ